MRDKHFESIKPDTYIVCLSCINTKVGSTQYYEHAQVEVYPELKLKTLL